MTRERQNAPLLFRLGRQMIRSRIRGGHRLCSLAERMGLLDTVVSYELPRDILFKVPLSNENTRWDSWDLLHYENQAIQRFCDALRELTDVTMFDCGADIGAFSVLVCVSSTAIHRIFAFEPSRAAFAILSENIAAVPVEGHAYCEAVGNMETVGELVSPDYDASSHARFVTPGKGDTKIITIDSLGRTDRNVAFKIDVEGFELEVLEGARRTIAGAENVVIVLEAHPEVSRRTGRNPIVYLQYLSGIRPFRFVFADSGESISLDRDLPVWDWTTHNDILSTTV